MAKRASASVLSLLLVLAALPPSVRAQSPTDNGAGSEIVPKNQMPPGVPETKDETPAALRWMLRPLKHGMLVRLPVVDTDPNRGVTYGVMPILVVTDDAGRIRQIHAPSLTYNDHFRFSPTYRYYWYPQEDASLVARVSWAKFEHEVMGQYEDSSFLGSPYRVLLRGQLNADAGQRFFGVGPDSPQSAEANYKQEYWQYRWAFGAPLKDGSPWSARVSQRYMSSRILDGPIPGLPDFHTAFPKQFADRSQQTNETRLSVDYDTRDHAVTTERGAYLDVFAESAVEGFLSAYSYRRYGTDARWFKPWPKDPSEVFAVQLQYEQILGPTPPFWILPQLGGKYSLRAYGDGRYTDRGMTALNVEQRIKLAERKTAGVTTEFQLAPFAGVGTVFDSPGEMAARYLRPVVGAAIRAVAKPQVVGSVDFGVGREGLAIFTDINYSF
ncbi:MAG: BamA/TamA family outer membrane protein [Elusimicrobia bacterium]|nr:BamA/TamA family outer membrane protein [Elusimicrobiota bacterium]